MTLAQFGRKAGCGREGETAQTFVGEIDGNAKARVLNKETLDFVHGPDVFRNVSREDAFAIRADAVQMLVDVRDAVFPKLAGLPFRRRKFIFHRRFLTSPPAADSVKRCRLTGLLIDVHLRDKVVHALLDWGL